MAARTRIAKSTRSRKPSRSARGAASVVGRAAPIPVLSSAQKLEIYYYLRLTRMVEERLSLLYRQGKVQGGLYSSRGQEAISIGSTYALQPQDVVAPTIRNLGAMLVRGVAPREFFLQYMQREGSPCRGRDTGLHFGTVDRGLVAPISHLGTMIPVLTGVALAAKMLKRPLVGLTYIGDGSTSTGDFHEGMGFASVLRVPLVVIIENNRWAYSTPVARQSRLADLAEKGRAYGIPRGVVDGNDVMAVFEATSRATALARSGEGPVLLECKTMRMKGHSEHDDAAYVPEEEKRFWARRDPIALFERQLMMDGTAREAELKAIEERCRTEIERALEEALAAPFPRPESGVEDVYAPADTPTSDAGAGDEPVSSRGRF